MRHRTADRTFRRTPAPRQAMFANLAMALVESGRIRTTDAKAKDLRRVAERLVTLGKAGTLDARRRAYAELGGAGQDGHRGNSEPPRVEKVVRALFGELAERFKERKGGYTRIIKIGRRKGDNAPVSIIEFVGYEPAAAGEAAGE